LPLEAYSKSKIGVLLTSEPTFPEIVKMLDRLICLSHNENDNHFQNSYIFILFSGYAVRPMIESKLKHRGYRPTKGRKAVLSVLTSTTGHLSVEEIYMKVYSEYPSIGLTSVYRTLEILVNLGMVHKFDFMDRKARYELANIPGSKKHHHHIICTSCGKIIDYTDFVDEELALVRQTEKHLSEKYNFKINNHVIQYYGLCEKCRKSGEL